MPTILTDQSESVNLLVMRMKIVKSQPGNKSVRRRRANTKLRYLNSDDKALRNARIDDFCAKNGIETVKFLEVEIPEDPKWSLWGAK